MMTDSAARATPALSWSSTSLTAAGSATWSCRGRSCFVVVSGELTWRTSRWLHSSFRRIVDRGGRELKLDLRAVSEADPAGVAVLLVYSRLLPTLGGSLEIPEASGPCRALVERMQLPHLLGQRQVAPPAAGALDPALRSCLTDDLRQRQDERRAYSTALLGVS